MKITHLFLFVFCFSFPGGSQNQRGSYRNFPVTVFYGTKLLQAPAFNKQLNSFGNYKFNNSISFIGVGLKYAYRVNAWYKSEMCLYYNQVIPQEIRSGDSSMVKISGFQAGLSLYGFDLITRRNMPVKGNQLFLMFGFNTGRLKLTFDDNLKGINPFFSPKVTLKPTFKISQLYLSFLVEYEYDISKQAWKFIKGEAPVQPVVNKLSQSGISVFLNLGFYIKYKTEMQKKIDRNKKKANNKARKKNK